MSRHTAPPASLNHAEIAPDTPIDLMQMIRVLWAGRWIVALMISLSVLAAGYYGFALAGPRHAATSVIVQDPASPALQSERPKPGTQIQVLLATATLQQVIDRLGLHNDPAFNRYLRAVPPLSLTALRTQMRSLLSGQTPPPPDAAAKAAKLVQNLRHAIRVDNPRDSDLLRITVTAGNPDRAVLIANTLADVYLADQTRTKREAAAASVAWLNAKLATLQVDQSTTETAIAELTAQAGLQDPTARDTLGRQLRDTTARLTTAEAALQRASDPANRQRLTRQTEALQASRDDLSSALDALSAAQTGRDRMQLDLDTQLAQQADYQERLRELALRAGQIGPDARLLNAASEAQYIGPQKLLLLQIAALVGALAGLMLVVLRHVLRRGFTDATALQDATGLPVLAQLPQLPSRQPARLLDTLDRADPTAATEGFRHLRTALLMGGQTVPQIILSTSAIPGEGKTTQAIGLAHSLALIGKRVLLVDADLRQSAFRRYFHLAQNDGLAAVIVGHVGMTAAIEPSAIANVDLLSGGAQDQGGADCLFLPALGDVLAQARTLYDIIVIDAPPVVPVPDALALARHADRVVFAVRWDKTPAPVVLAATAKLAAANVQITGLTLTQVNARKQAQRGGVSFMRYGRGYFHG